MQSHPPRSLLLGALLTLSSAPAAQALGPTDFIAYWDFEEGAGTLLNDLSGGGIDGLISGAQWGLGALGQGLWFDGSDDYVELTDGAGYPELLGGLSEGTISIWFRFGSVPPANQIHPLFYLGDGVGGAGHSGLVLEVGHFGTSTELFYTLHTDNAFIPLCFDTGFQLLLDEWYHFCLVVGPGFNRGYLNGTELNEVYNFGTAFGTEFLDDVVDQKVAWLGRGLFYGVPQQQYHDGAIDEVRIYDRALAASEIQDYYQDVLTCNGPSAITIRFGSPANPAVFLPGPAGAPTLGGTWDPSIDHASFQPNAVLDFVGGSASSVNLPSALGTILIDPATIGFVATSSQPGTPFAIPVPSTCPLIGAKFYTQGGSVSPTGEIALTNGLDLTVGTF
ncbi:MAG: LamG domain-containing protein [Planctomycetota bacterium]